MEDEKKKWNKIKASTRDKTRIARIIEKKICYIVTENKSHSWMEDLYTFEKKPLIDRIYN